MKVEQKNAFQPKDTGKLTNFHYGTKEDQRQPEVLATEGTKDGKAKKL
jgi:hypothetical protein